MEPSNALGIWCALMATIQTLAAVYGYVEAGRKRKLEVEGSPMLSKFNPLPVSIILTVGALGTIALTIWVFTAHPLRPQIQTVEKTVYVDKPIPCPPPLPATKTGNATNRGNNGIANSGSIGSAKQGKQ